MAGVAYEPAYVHVVLLDGQIIGHWRRGPSAKRWPWTCSSPARLTTAKRYGAFVDLPANWTE